MATIYKVWIVVEAYDTETEIGEEEYSDFGECADFDDADAAQAYAQRLYDQSQATRTGA